MSAIGVIKYRKQRSSIKMPENATFLDEICDEVKAAGIYNDSYAGKKIIAFFRNAPAHSQTEVLLPEREGLSPTAPRALHFMEMGRRLTRDVEGEEYMRLLELAAYVSMTHIAQNLVLKIEPSLL
ncbi:hypothetical protein PF005_g12237 [Phytophthora fragariae]|uniref:Tc1-like transposase DDE domain-containing protein n=2 Tax=Phytophthora fragariae TaxID=53985 RepID=A0A6A3EX55_9STRA|nr:hypothetical protein PF009_g13458 [Phytophthora fragariae]KAE9208394.1 hypothetical protein PF005_g12237 [Phytophthora fragariae]KAE9227697.1 hypothetical protein PF004_g11291 [Phytophthora fragariae]KAE9307753.1 hypothetical protein PF001_g11462 [Phytophthora fragariae]